MAHSAGGIVALCGGVGAARFLDGLVRVVAPERVTAVVNVADDAEFHGLHVSPDLDTVLYTLAGLVDETNGWGVRGDTSNVGTALARLGRDTWFRLGDADLATHIHRTALLREGLPLSAVTDRLRTALGIRARLIPSTDDRQRTLVRCAEGWLAFQEYFVHRGTRDAVLAVRFDGDARPAPGVREAIAAAALVVIAPSNPIVSIAPILAVAGVREALAATAARVVAVSPIVGGRAIKGPAAAMLETLGHEVSPVGIAGLYADLIDLLVIDEEDAALADAVVRRGPAVRVAPTLMCDAETRAALARTVLAAAGLDAG